MLGGEGRFIKLKGASGGRLEISKDQYKWLTSFHKSEANPEN